LRKELFITEESQLRFEPSAVFDAQSSLDERLFA
jgi:hypothetical protein